MTTPRLKPNIFSIFTFFRIVAWGITMIMLMMIPEFLEKQCDEHCVNQNKKVVSHTIYGCVCE